MIYKFTNFPGQICHFVVTLCLILSHPTRQAPLPTALFPRLGALPVLCDLCVNSDSFALPWPTICFQSLTTIKFSKPLVLTTMRIAGGVGTLSLPCTSLASLSSLECAVPRFRVLSPLEYADPKTRRGNSFRMRSYEKQGRGCPVSTLAWAATPSGLHHARLFSQSCTLFCTTGCPQLFWNQFAAHSFHRDGVCVPP